MHERVVLPLDGTVEAEEVFDLVRSELTPMPMVFPLTVVNTAVVAAGGFAFWNEGWERDRRQDGMAYLRDAVSRRGWAGMRYQCVVKGNLSAAKGIVEFAVEWRADLIAMTTGTRSGLSRLMPGSLAEEVVRLSPVKVMVLTGRELALAS
ncbi:MAG: universal stress protein [Dehalococcoidia bacterium]|nr:universal stress protein [Dehalococcoidia bacterium]